MDATVVCLAALKKDSFIISVLLLLLSNVEKSSAAYTSVFGQAVLLLLNYQTTAWLRTHVSFSAFSYSFFPSSITKSIIKPFSIFLFVNLHAYFIFSSLHLFIHQLIHPSLVSMTINLITTVSGAMMDLCNDAYIKQGCIHCHPLLSNSCFNYFHHLQPTLCSWRIK